MDLTELVKLSLKQKICNFEKYIADNLKIISNS